MSFSPLARRLVEVFGAIVEMAMELMFHHWATPRVWRRRGS
jgi:hypothetical protein